MSRSTQEPIQRLLVNDNGCLIDMTKQFGDCFEKGLVLDAVLWIPRRPQLVFGSKLQEAKKHGMQKQIESSIENMHRMKNDYLCRWGKCTDQKAKTLLSHDMFGSALLHRFRRP